MQQESLPFLPPPVIQSIKRFKDFVEQHPGSTEAIMAKVLEDHEEKLVTLMTNINQMMIKAGKLEGEYYGITNTIYEIMMEKEREFKKKTEEESTNKDRRSCVSLDDTKDK